VIGQFADVPKHEQFPADGLFSIHGHLFYSFFVDANPPAITCHMSHVTPCTLYDIWPRIICQSESTPLETDHFLTTDRNEPVNLAGQLRLFLPANCSRFGQDNLEVAGTHPVDADGSADVWVGKMGDRRIAIKSYRCWASAVQIYEVSNSIRCVTFTDNQHVGIPQ